MDINKALRKQKKSYKRFLLSMGFIFLIMPIVLVISDRINMFFIIYLIIIESLILLLVLIKAHNQSLKYEYKQYKLDIVMGLMNLRISLLCDKVVLIHADKQGDDLEIIIVTVSKFRNKNIKPIERNFLLKKTILAKSLEPVMAQHPENKYFYTIIKDGGYFKYELLDLLYTSCVNAIFTDITIERIKEYRC